MPGPIPPFVSIRLGRPSFVPGRSSCLLPPVDPRLRSIILAANTTRAKKPTIQTHIHMVSTSVQTGAIPAALSPIVRRGGAVVYDAGGPTVAPAVNSEHSAVPPDTAAHGGPSHRLPTANCAA